MHVQRFCTFQQIQIARIVNVNIELKNSARQMALPAWLKDPK